MTSLLASKPLKIDTLKLTLYLFTVNMGHPLGKYVNLTLTIPIKGKTSERDPETGNMVSVGDTKKIIKATVEASTNTQRQYPGLNAHALYLTGFLVSPKKQPVEFKAGMRVQAKFLDPYTKRETVGEFILDLVDQSRFKAVSKVLGNEIKGWFQTV